MSDEKFEEFLKQAARGYNAPPARTPREEMWNAIQAKRSAGPRVVYGGASNLPRTNGNRFGTKIWWAAAAAVVLVASGIGIGRLTAPASAPVVATAPRPTVTRPEPTPSNDPASIDVAPSQPGGVAAGARGTEQTPFASEGSGVVVARGRTRSSTLANDGMVAARAGTTQRDEPARAGSRGSSPTLAYELAEANHLSAAEALLTSFRTRSAADQQQDARLASWARELLSNTRLLLDSPVAADPQRRPLLQDLELLLVQIVQLSPGSTPQDREIMEKTLKQDQLMTRLRTAIPAGQRGS